MMIVFLFVFICICIFLNVATSTSITVIGGGVGGLVSSARIANTLKGQQQAGPNISIINISVLKTLNILSVSTNVKNRCHPLGEKCLRRRKDEFRILYCQ